MTTLVLNCLLITALATNSSLARGIIQPQARENTEVNQISQLPSGPSKQLPKEISSEDMKSFIQREGRALVPPMEMLDPRRPKPKPPMGNDIGMARIRSLPDKAYRPSLPDRMEATVSIGYTMDTKRKQEAKDDEAKVVSRELHEILESVPTIYLPNFPIEYHRDPEQEAINQRITEVARQLTEAALRKEYENGQLRKVLPLPQESARSAQDEAIESSEAVTEEEESITEVLETTEETTEEVTTQATTDKDAKSAKSLDISKAQPLVSHLPQEGQNMQLIADVQSVPYMMLNEGFLPSPQYAEPLLGGPSIAQDGVTVQRMPKKLSTPTQQPFSPPPFETVNLPNFLKIVSPRYKFSSNDLVVSVPISGGILPAIISGKNTWWTDPSYKEIVERRNR